MTEPEDVSHLSPEAAFDKMSETSTEVAFIIDTIAEMLRELSDEDRDTVFVGLFMIYCPQCSAKLDERGACPCCDQLLADDII